MKVNAKARFNPGNLGPAQFAERTATILRQYDKVIFPAFKDEIRAVQYNWPRPTRRSRGQVVTSPRDIVDTGAFIRSQIRKTTGPQSLELAYSWGGGRYGVNYAGIILAGIPERGYPGRDWIKPALDKHPLDAFFIAAWRQLSSKQKKPPGPLQTKG